MKTIYDIHRGDQANISATFSDADVVLFACMTGDFNPVHIDKDYAENHGFKGCVLPDMLVAGLISTVLGKLIPIPESRVIRQNIAFFSPAYIGDTLTAYACVTRRNHHGNQVLVSVQCVDQRGNDVIRGDVVMEVPDMVSTRSFFENQGVHAHA